jgi:hypothetical protein
MAWSESYITQLIQHLVRHDADPSELRSDFVRIGFERLALEAPVFELTSNINIVALQRTYDLVNIHIVTEVKLDGQQIPRLGKEYYPSQSWYQRGQLLVLNWEPGSAGVLTVTGFGVPATIDGLTTQPEKLLQMAVAWAGASKFLSTYGDARALARAQVYEQMFARIVQQLKRRYNTTLERTDRQRASREIPIL